MTSILEFYVNYRSEIINVIGGVENASSYLYWDNTTPNFSTKRELSAIYEKYIKNSEAFGIHMLDRHCECGNIKHYEINPDGYVMDYPADPSIKYGDSRFVWIDTIDNGEIDSVCPCSTNQISSKHRVLRQVCFDANAEHNICETINSIFNDIRLAIRNSGDKQPRSAIREYLLRAVIKLNDAILPVSMDEYIERMVRQATM